MEIRRGAIKCAIVHNGKFLLMKRNLEKEFSPGKWEFPSGRMEKGEETEEAVKREVMEETGLDVSPEKKCSFEKTSNGKIYTFTCFMCETSEDNIKMSDEHTELVWIDAEGMKKMDLSDSTRKSIELMGI